ADTSTEIAFKYFDKPKFHVDAQIVTNNHFDADGLAAMFVLIDPATAQRHRDLLIDVASAGDFDVFKSRDAARIAFAIASISEADTSPLSKAIFALPYPEMAAELYSQALKLVPQLLSSPNDFRSLWASEDDRLSRSEESVRQGIIEIDDHPELD